MYNANEFGKYYKWHLGETRVEKINITCLRYNMTLITNISRNIANIVVNFAPSFSNDFQSTNK